MSSILVKLPNWMGDILFSFDVIYTLSKHFQRVGLLTSSAHAELFEVFPFQNLQIVDYPADNWPNLKPETIVKIERFRPDLGLLLPNSLGSALALRYAGVSRIFGYASEMRNFLLERSLPVPTHKMHQTEYFAELLKLFELPVETYPTAAPANRNRMVIIHPGASKPPRGWHLERFLQVAEELTKAQREVIFVSGDPISTAPYLSVIKPSLNDFCALLRKSSLFIGNDSGPLHLAQQCGVPVVGIYGPGDPIVTGPRVLSPSRVVYHGFPCSPCRQKFFKECDPAPSNKPYCIETISIAEVLKASSDLL
jgi:heptosyltransferase-2